MTKLSACKGWYTCTHVVKLLTVLILNSHPKSLGRRLYPGLYVTYLLIIFPSTRSSTRLASPPISAGRPCRALLLTLRYRSCFSAPRDAGRQTRSLSFRQSTVSELNEAVRRVHAEGIAYAYCNTAVALDNWLNRCLGMAAIWLLKAYKVWRLFSLHKLGGKLRRTFPPTLRYVNCYG